MVRFGWKGNILFSEAECLAIPVNTVGVAGAGLAAQAMPRGSDALRRYVAACRSRDLATGKVFIFDTEINSKKTRLALVPTKGHWREDSAIEMIRSSLRSLVAESEKFGLKTVAVPMLGCGLGGLEWSDVSAVVDAELSESSVIFMVHGDPPTKVSAKGKPN